MKSSYLKISILFLGLITFITSCDKIPEDDRLIELGEVDWAGKYVVLEDYTGHRCNNCPTAALIADGLKEIYKEKLIVIGVHAPDGIFTKPISAYPEDFRTTEGNTWAEAFGVSDLPKGMVNRVNFNNGRVLGRDEWAAAITKEMLITPALNLDLSVDYDDQTRNVTIRSTATFTKNITENMRINALLLQDSIKGSQLLPSGAKDTNYIFSHVLRKTLEGAWGKSFVNASDGYKANDTKQYQLTFKLEDIYANIPVDPKHCHIVVYVTTDEFVKTGGTYQILQAAEVSLIKKKESKK